MTSSFASVRENVSDEQLATIAGGVRAQPRIHPAEDQMAAHADVAVNTGGIAVAVETIKFSAPVSTNWHDADGEPLSNISEIVEYSNGTVEAYADVPDQPGAIQVLQLDNGGTDASLLVAAAQQAGDQVSISGPSIIPIQPNE